MNVIDFLMCVATKLFENEVALNGPVHSSTQYTTWIRIHWILYKWRKHIAIITKR